jgi:hypothetical protein
MTHYAARFTAPLVLAALAALPALGAGQSTRNQATRDGAILALHPLAYWPLDDAGAVVADKTSNGNDGFYEGARGGAPGSNGWATAHARAWASWASTTTSTRAGDRSTTASGTWWRRPTTAPEP